MHLGHETVEGTENEVYNIVSTERLIRSFRVGSYIKIA